MGLSSSKSKTTTNQTQNQTTTGTQTPITPDYLENAARDYVGRIQQFGNTNPQSYVAPASSLQQQAWQQAGQLGSQPGSQQAMDMAQQAGQSPANLGGAFTYQAPQLGPASQATATDAQSQSLLDNFQAYQSPYTRDVVNATLDDYDHGVEQQQARLAAQGAKSGAFGGSRFGVAEAELAGNAARGRALTSAQLRDQGFRTAAGLSQADAAARQQAELFNAQNRTDVSGQNAASQNQFALAQGGLDQAAGQYNAGAQQQGSQFNAGQQDAAQARALQAAQLMGALTSDQSANNRANVQTLAQLGEQQRGISQSQALAPLAQLQAMGQLSGMTPYDILVGRQVNGTQTGTMQGTSVTKQSPSLFNQMLALGNFASGFIPGA
jgi:hypothetical protein